MFAQEIPLKRLLWAFPVALTCHNLEEAFTLPAWSKSAGLLHPPVGEVELWFALAVVTVAGYSITYVAWRYGGLWLHAAASGWVLMLLNVFFPHVLGALLTQHYTPGLLTAVTIIVPVDTYLLYRARCERALSSRRLLTFTLGAVLLALTTLPLLFWAGRSLASVL
ncbi:MAG: hypothetical protein JWN04_4037 [Myxococcaceae bacterium]|nr:hypothetical protein [Myxococcaceae bacterium]